MTTERPLVTVIIPNYNHGKYLRQRIDSVLRQDFQDFELIILDDKSTDDSLAVIREYEGQPHVAHIIANEKNTGNTFIQWERGINLAQGEYIWIAESDDVAKPQLLSTLIEALQAHQEAVVAFCHSTMIDSNGEPMEMSWHPHGSSGETIIYDGIQFNRRKMLVKNHIYNASMVVFKKSVFNKVPNDYQKYRYCGDWLFWVHVCTQGKVIEVCKQLNLYRQHNNKVTNHSLVNGGMWRDLGGIMCQYIQLFQLNKIQQSCLRGRWTKRFNKSAHDEDKAIRAEFPDIYNGTTFDIILYEIGKLFGFLKA